MRHETLAALLLLACTACAGRSRSAAAPVRFRGEVTDPAGDALVDARVPRPPDLVGASVEVSDAGITVRVRFARGTFDRDVTSVTVQLDTDMNTGTGIHPPGGIGIDYVVNAGQQFFGPNVAVSRATGGAECGPSPARCYVETGRAPLVFHADGIDATVPRALLPGVAGPLDFRVQTSVKFATERFAITTDHMPDQGLPAGHVR